jgi:hypothetical protein
MPSTIWMRTALLSLFLCAIASPARAQGKIIMLPYLQAVNATSVYVLVESEVADTATADYGTSRYTTSARTESIELTDTGTFVHNIKLTGLLPNVVYHYRVRQGPDSTADAAFRTAVEPGTPFRFAWMADNRSGNEVHDSISLRIRSADPAFSLYGGDISANARYLTFKEQFFRPVELTLISHVPFFNTPGNHEKWGTNTKAFTQAPVSASGVQDYYSFDYGDMHVVVVNNEVPYDTCSQQYDFVAHDLSTSKRTWKMVISHRPAYCAGGHGEDPDMKVLTANVFEPNMVDAVISGHSHFYQHNLVNGIHHMVLGTAGAPLYEPGSAFYTIKCAKEYNFGIADVSPTTFHLMVYNDRGAILDSLVLRKPESP